AKRACAGTARSESFAQQRMRLAAHGRISTLIEGSTQTIPRDPIEKLVAGADIETANGIERGARTISVLRRRENRCVAKSAEVDDRARCTGIFEENPVGKRRDRRALAALRQVALAQITDDGCTRPTGG